ncbi:MAG TPA: type II secretion system protein GspC [Kofleriaceae bacterium]|nr:type II secretion system protein GspC [Kofleriaceae bacterium]
MPDPRAAALAWRPSRARPSASAILVALAVIGSAASAARLVNRVVEGRYLADGSHGPEVRAAAPVHLAAPAPKDGAALVARNMFCSDCPPPAGPAAGPPPAGAPPPPLTLLATHVGADSLAFVRNLDTEAEGAYRVGQRITGAGELVAIHRRSIDVRTAGGDLAHVSLDGPAASPAAAAAAAPAAPTAPAAAATDPRIHRVADDTFEIDRSLITDALTGRAPAGIRVVPSTAGGISDGFRVATVTPGSVYAAIGLARGDVIRGVNGLALDSLDKAMDAVTRLRDASSIELAVSRNGRPVTLRYQLH